MEGDASLERRRGRAHRASHRGRGAFEDAGEERILHGADVVTLAHMALSNAALWDAIEACTQLAPAAVVLGGGGYNPWTLTRYWSGLWARLSGQAIPDALPPGARAVLERLSCDLVDEEDMKPEWLATLADAVAPRCVRPEVRALRDAALARARLEGVVA
jgi:acetoin utilization protein AcuC